MITHLPFGFKVETLVVFHLLDWGILKSWKWLPTIVPKMFYFTPEEEEKYRWNLHLVASITGSIIFLFI